MINYEYNHLFIQESKTIIIRKLPRSFDRQGILQNTFKSNSKYKLRSSVHFDDDLKKHITFEKTEEEEEVESSSSDEHDDSDTDDNDNTITG